MPRHHSRSKRAATQAPHSGNPAAWGLWRAPRRHAIGAARALHSASRSCSRNTVEISQHIVTGAASGGLGCACVWMQRRRWRWRCWCCCCTTHAVPEPGRRGRPGAPAGTRAAGARASLRGAGGWGGTAGKAECLQAASSAVGVRRAGCWMARWGVQGDEGTCVQGPPWPLESAAEFPHLPATHTRARTRG
jgi:hypothetical protein